MKTLTLYCDSVSKTPHPPEGHQRACQGAQDKSHLQSDEPWGRGGSGRKGHEWESTGAWARVGKVSSQEA